MIGNTLSWKDKVIANDHMRKCDFCKTQYAPEEWSKMSWGIGDRILCNKDSCYDKMYEDFEEFKKENESED
jgi:hypothetical protein